MTGQIIAERKEQSRTGSTVVWLFGHRFGGGDRRTVPTDVAQESGDRVDGVLMIRPSTHHRVAVGTHRQEWP